MSSTHAERATVSLTELPLDVLLLIIPYLSAHDLLALCGTCHSLYDDPEVKYSASYWSNLSRETFRVPNQPVVQADGQRWMRLYRRMRTQSRVYAWGNNDGGCFGDAKLVQGDLNRGIARRIQRRGGFHRVFIDYSPVPRPCPLGDVGIVSDFQCGGWMTVMLNSKGSLFIHGVMTQIEHPYQKPTVGDPKPLSYPAGFVSPSERYEATTAIRQFSTGQAHVLGLADSGRIWTWNDANHHALQVKFLTIGLREHSGRPLSTRDGLVTRVVAGWNRSSAYVTGTGIVLWLIVKFHVVKQSMQNDEEIDTTLVTKSWTIPDTKYGQPGVNSKATDAENLAQRVGEVSNWIVLDNFVVFVTTLGKVFASPIPAEDDQGSPARPFEIATGSTAPDADAIDVQGSHIYFALLLRNGEVLTGNTEKLQEAWHAHRSQDLTEATSVEFERIPSLQHTNVIALAFGDWHYHALHSNGTITSHGEEPSLRGAFGLGGFDAILLRGMTTTTQNAAPPNGLLLPESETNGRAVCFEPEKHHWVNQIRRGTHDSNQERLTAVFDRLEVRAVMSEWVEERLRKWEGTSTHPKNATDDDDGLPAFFALSVAAGGHHSGAIVLVNEEMAEATKARARARFRESAEAAAAAAAAALEKSTAPEGTRSLFESLSSSSSNVLQWFLGTQSATQPSQMRPAEPCSLCALRGKACTRDQPCGHCQSDGHSEECVYPEPSDWWLDSLPRLRLPSGEVLPGEGPIEDWQCPDWKTY